MKNIKYLFISLILLFIGCSNQSNQLKNLELSQVMNDINWYEDYSNVKELLESNYELEYDREVEQNEEGKKTYVFSGVKLNGIKTKNLSVVFNNDSLNSIVFTIEEDSENKFSADLKNIKNVISKLPIEQYYEDDSFWIAKDNEDENNGIQLAKNKKAILISISSEKYINKYSSI